MMEGMPHVLVVDDESHIAERLRAGAEEEREGLALADGVVVNHDVAQATRDVAAIVERSRSVRP